MKGTTVEEKSLRSQEPFLSRVSEAWASSAVGIRSLLGDLWSIGTLGQGAAVNMTSNLPIVETTASPPTGTLNRSKPPRLVPASRFTFDELVAAYNQTRVDYIVPMPMNAARLREYVHDYDVDLDLSAVALEDDRILGLAMLGVRPGLTWVTRLGILPVKRRRGTGQLLTEHLIAESHRLNVPCITLDVIKGNTPAECLFHKLGFRNVHELMVVRRPPGFPPHNVGPYTFQMPGTQQALGFLRRRQDTPSWLTDTPSLRNANHTTALCVELKNGGQGWAVYQETTFQLRRLILHTETGDPHQVGLALLHALHTCHPTIDTIRENLPVDDPHWPAMQEMGYIESFRRTEMQLELV